MDFKRLFLLVIDMESLSPFKGLSENNCSCASARRQTSRMFNYCLVVTDSSFYKY